MPQQCELCKQLAMVALDDRVAALTQAAGPAADHDVDGIHDVRVASRRIRALLRAHKKLFKKAPFRDFECRVKAVTRGLSTARELDVTIALLEKRRRKLKGSTRLATTQVIRFLREQRSEESPNVDAGIHLIGDGRFGKSMETIRGGVKSMKRCYLDTARTALTKRLDALHAIHTKWQQTRSEEDLHQVRIAFKRLRYSCEIFDPLYGKAMQDYVKTLKSAQEHLGDWNDLRVMRDYVEHLARGVSGDAVEGVPLLHGQLERDADALLESFESDAATFFSGESLDKARALFASPSKECCNPKLQRME